MFKRFERCVYLMKLIFSLIEMVLISFFRKIQSKKLSDSLPGYVYMIKSVILSLSQLSKNLFQISVIRLSSIPRSLNMTLSIILSDRSRAIKYKVGEV